MDRQTKPAKIEHFTPPRTARKAIRLLKGYADIQHFYKSRQHYTQTLTDNDNESGFILGYN